MRTRAPPHPTAPAAQWPHQRCCHLLCSLPGRANVPEAAVEIRFKNLSVQGTQIIKADEQGLLGKLKVGCCAQSETWAQFQ